MSHFIRLMLVLSTIFNCWLMRAPSKEVFLVNLQIDLLGGDAELFDQVDASLKDLEVWHCFTLTSIVIIIAIFFIIVIIIQGGFFNWSALKMTKCQFTCKSLQKISKCQNFLRVWYLVIFLGGPVKKTTLYHLSSSSHCPVCQRQCLSQLVEHKDRSLLSWNNSFFSRFWHELFLYWLTQDPCSRLKIGTCYAQQLPVDLWDWWHFRPLASGTQKRNISFVDQYLLKCPILLYRVVFLTVPP